MAAKKSDKERPSRTRIKEMMGIAVSKFIKGLEGGTGISKEQCMLDAGYAPSTANKQNHKIIQHPDYIAWTERKSENDFASKSAIEKRFNRFASSNIVDYFDIVDGHLVLKDLKALPRQLTDCIESIKETKFGIEIKLVSKLTALEDLCKMNGLFIAKVEHTGDVGPTIYYIGSDNLTKEVADKIATPKNRLKDYDNPN